VINFFEELQGKTIVISGASKLGDMGVNLVHGSRNEAELLRVAAEIDTQGGSVYPLLLDVTDESSVQGFLDKTLHRFGKIDGLINSSSGYQPQGVVIDEITIMPPLGIL
jgi:NADP-dependent 3-hydroxy acid dehydrogenase YdfG